MIHDNIITVFIINELILLWINILLIYVVLWLLGKLRKETYKSVEDIIVAVWGYAQRIWLSNGTEKKMCFIIYKNVMFMQHCLD